MARKKQAAKAVSCWHCQNTNRCGCMFCLVQTPTGEAPGPCGFCKGRKASDELRPYLEKHRIDPRDPKHWERRGNKRDQLAPKLVFLPEEQFRHEKETQGET